MKTANLYSEVPIGLPKWESVSESAELGDSEKLAEFLSPTIKDIVQFKALVTMCPNFTPIAKFALGEDNLRLVLEFRPPCDRIDGSPDSAGTPKAW